jgi:hypothetical protein
MKAKIILIAGIILSTVLSSCVSIMTRTETDIHTISERDTIFSYEQKNAPGNQDMGVVYPSSRTFKSERRLYQRDSIVERKYPDFIRLGVFESVGLIGSASGESSYGTGMFGIFPDFINLKSDYSGDSGKLFSGGIYRIGVGEWRLRWFKDAPNWTFGTSMIEFLIPSAKKQNTLSSIFPLYIRKRYYLRNSIYCICPFFRNWLVSFTICQFIWIFGYRIIRRAKSKGLCWISSRSKFQRSISG